MYVYLYIYLQAPMHTYVFFWSCNISSNHPGWAKLKGLHLGVCSKKPGAKQNMGERGETGYVWAHTYIYMYKYIYIYVFIYIYIGLH